MDNFAAANALNDKSLLTGKLTIVSGIVIVVVGSENHHSSQMFLVTLSWKDDDGTAHNAIMKNYFYFPSSPVNAIRVERLSLQWGENISTGDDVKFIESICSQS